ncbi:TetR family transcriptional regulator [Rubrivivax gelatinosus]|nr:TetR family transcriptional regulator [Rubrivivax gelatinosus]
MGLRESKKDKTRLQLLEKALDLFSRQGYEETTIAQIAAEVEVSPRTLLRYFPTKEDIVVSWIEESMSNFLTRLDGRPAGETVQQSLIACARGLLAAYEARKPFYLSLERMIAASPAISDRKQGMTARLADEVADEIARSRGAEAPDGLARHVYPHALFAVLRAVITQWVRADGAPSLQQLLDQALRLVDFEPARAS